MAKYLIQANYTKDGTDGLLNEGGSARADATKALFESVGGKVECMYYAFGKSDVYVIADVPDNVSMAAMSLVVNQAGAVTAHVTVLLTAEEIDAAAKMTPQYRPAGK